MGHGAVIDGRGALILATEDGTPEPVFADEIGLMLQDYGVLLAVLNGCVTGSADMPNSGQSVAHALVRQGVPAAIATIRNIEDDVALRFASDFYRAFLLGEPAEGALVEARKALSLAGSDWSAYVLYGSVKFPLQEIRIPWRANFGS